MHMNYFICSITFTITAHDVNSVSKHIRSFAVKVDRETINIRDKASNIFLQEIS